MSDSEECQGVFGGTSGYEPEVPPTWDRLVTEVNYLEIARQEARRTLLCHPDAAPRLRAAITASDLADILTVREASHLEPGQIIVIDEAAYQAGTAELLQKIRHTGPFGRL
jgi:hypothetical protein